jgi:hypothetical protein
VRSLSVETARLEHEAHKFELRDTGFPRSEISSPQQIQMRCIPLNSEPPSIPPRL